MERHNAMTTLGDRGGDPNAVSDEQPDPGGGAVCVLRPSAANDVLAEPTEAGLTAAIFGRLTP
jgi:hypothetical protein